MTRTFLTMSQRHSKRPTCTLSHWLERESSQSRLMKTRVKLMGHARFLSTGNSWTNSRKRKLWRKWGAKWMNNVSQEVYITRTIQLECKKSSSWKKTKKLTGVRLLFRKRKHHLRKSFRAHGCHPLRNLLSTSPFRSKNKHHQQLKRFQLHIFWTIQRLHLQYIHIRNHLFQFETIIEA